MPKRNALIRYARLTAIAIVVGINGSLVLFGNGCGKGLFPEITTSATATIVPTSVAGGTFVYASNFNDANIAELQRTSSGGLGIIGSVNAGAVGGPVGLAVTPNNGFLYVANSADNLVHEFQIVASGSKIGTLTSLGTIAAGTAPQMVAIDTTSTYVYVTNSTSRSVSMYSIGSDGDLTSIGTLTGFTGSPFGILTNPNGTYVYVADNTAGLIYTYTIGSNGVLAQNGSPMLSNGTSAGSPGLMAIAVDSTQSYLMVDDTSSGVVSVFLIQSNGTLAYNASFGTGQSTPIGIAAVNDGGNSSNNYVFTANMGGGFVQSYLRGAAILTQENAAIGLNGPTGLIVDPSALYVYTGDSGDGTVAQLTINGSCGTTLCLVSTFATENPANPSAGTQYLAGTH